MNSKIITSLAVVGLIIIVGIFWFSGDSAKPEPQMAMQEQDVEVQPAPISNTVPPNPPSISSGTSTTSTSSIKEFTVLGENFKFSISQLKVKKGDTVRITFKNVMGTHDWRLDEFNAKTKILKSGEQETVEFVADKTGTFEYYCSIGSHRQMGMKGAFIVE